MTAHRTDLLVAGLVEVAGSFGAVGWGVVRTRALSRMRCVVVVVADVVGLEEEGRTGWLRADLVRESGRTVYRTLAGCGVVGNRLLMASGMN